MKVLLLCVLVAGAFAAPLPAFNVDPKQTSVSGLSSGGYFAVQMQVAFSSTIVGAGIFAGGPDHCAKGDISVATTTCMSAILGAPNGAELAAYTVSRAKAGAVDDVENMKKQRVFMFSGTKDTTVKPPVMNSLRDYYKSFIPDSQIVYDKTFVAAHTQPTDDPVNKNSCTLSASPFISNCNYDGAGKALTQIYGPLAPRTEGPLKGEIIKFDQAEFGGADMAATGYAFVPKECKEGQSCRLHISFHGCKQNYDAVQDAYVADTGYNKWADTNNIIVVYPQTSNSATNACWNWWGYHGDTYYDEKKGSQMSAMKRIIDRIGSGMKPPISAPKHLKVDEATEASVTLSWEPVVGADAYRIFRDGAAIATSILAPMYTDVSVVSGTTYEYAVAGIVGKSYEGERSAPVTAKTAGNPPPIAAPTGLEVTKVTNSTVSLAWATVKGATGYSVYRDGAKESKSLFTTNSFTDTDLEPEKTYSYTVTAISENGQESAKSAPVTATTSSSFQCQEYTASNYAHVLAGRAHDTSGIAYANGSNQKLGLDNIFLTATLAETESGYFIVGRCSAGPIVMEDSMLNLPRVI